MPQSIPATTQARPCSPRLGAALILAPLVLAALTAACGGEAAPPGRASPEPPADAEPPSVAAEPPDRAGRAEDGVLRSARLDGRRVAYLDAGSGDPPIVLVHGWACDHRVWRKQVGSLSRAHRVLAVDLPGHGDSEEPLRPYSMELFADALAAVLDEAGEGRAILVGHSNGTPAVRQFWRGRPERVAGLVFVDGPLVRVMDEATVAPYVEAFESEGWRVRVARIVETMPHSGLAEEDVALISQMAVSQSQGAVAGGLRAAVSDEIWGVEETIDVPCLVLKAEQATWSESYRAKVRELIPGVDYRTWTDVSHFLQLERPEEFNALIEDFVRRVAAGSPSNGRQ